MEYIREMHRQDLDVVSEFLVMAATLLDIKSRMLLPREVDEEGEEIDPRQELVEKLLMEGTKKAQETAKQTMKKMLKKDLKIKDKDI